MSMIDFLKKRRRFKRACERFMENPQWLGKGYYPRRGDIAAAIYHFRHFTLHDAFDWNETPEGRDYWRDLQMEYEIENFDSLIFIDDVYPEERFSNIYKKEYKPKKFVFNYVYSPKPIPYQDNPSFKLVAEKGAIGMLCKSLGMSREEFFKLFTNPEFNVFTDTMTAANLSTILSTREFSIYKNKIKHYYEV